MNISGAAGILKTASNISLAGTLSVSASNPSLEGGTVALSGGTLKADNDITVKSDLTSQADSSISVAAGKTITTQVISSKLVHIHLLSQVPEALRTQVH